jgi:hypothetical protein
LSVADHLFRVDRADTVRWVACFVVVVAAHGMAALSLLQSPAASDFDAGAPVVMLELPEAPAAPSLPPTDLAPGPPEMESEPTPPPKEETKPIEQEAEVALPVPEPSRNRLSKNVRRRRCRHRSRCRRRPLRRRRREPRYIPRPHSSDGKANSPPISNASSATRRAHAPTASKVLQQSPSLSTMKAIC